MGALAFMSPWILAALLALPVIWWLLRATPPSPKHVRFPAVRLLLGLENEEQTPARTPWWVLALRIAAAALVIFALADPVLNAMTRGGTGPVVIAVDDGWAAAQRWSARESAMLDLINAADRAGRPVVLLPTAPSAAPSEPQVLSAGEARRIAEAMQPSPWSPDRRAALGVLDKLDLEAPLDTVWLSDGLDEGDATIFADELIQRGALHVVSDPEGEGAWALGPAEGTADGLTVPVLRPDAGPEIDGVVRALADDGRFLGEAPFTFPRGETRTQAALALPTELRNAAARMEIDGRSSAGSVALLDARFRRFAVGLASGGGAERAQPLLDETYYVERALAPYADLRKGTPGELLGGKLSLLVLADVGQLVGADKDAAERFVAEGGVLLRFAGPRMTGATDDLLPVRLRLGDRALGSALSWENPQGLAAFPEGSPFAGLTAPADIAVRRQVLAEPAVDLAQRTWARLSDGTPLVTAAQRGEGWVVLVHVTANADWSNLPLSGLFVEMLRRVLTLGAGVAPDDAGEPDGARLLPALRTLDGFGRLGAPPASAVPAPFAAIASLRAGPAHPPGYYGAPDAAFAINVLTAEDTLRALPDLPSAASTGAYETSTSLELKWPLLVLAVLLVFADTLVALWLAGRLRLRPERVGAALALGLALAAVPSLDAQAQESAWEAALDFRLAYVKTGVADVDQVSQAGLAGLSRALEERTAAEPAPPVGVDLERDELAFYPLLYWPMDRRQADPSPEALARLDAFLKNGGMILFDTRDGGGALTGLQGARPAGPGEETLRRIVGRLDLPPLEQVPEGHVLTKAFYLLREFPGRYAGSAVWVEAIRRGPDGAPERGAANDGVSSVIIGANDWASAWARDEMGRTMAPLEPGGERQREMAVRFGVNLVMYALTGNYKADQVHVPALLERLGQ